MPKDKVKELLSKGLTRKIKKSSGVQFSDKERRSLSNKFLMEELKKASSSQVSDREKSYLTDPNSSRFSDKERKSL